MEKEEKENLVEKIRPKNSQNIQHINP